MINPNRLLSILFLITFAFAIGMNFYKYYYTRDYAYIIEVPCDPNTEICFTRDCSGEKNDCPANQLSEYKKFRMRAYDFPNCKEDTCKTACEQRTINCTPIPCTEADSCTTLPATK